MMADIQIFVLLLLPAVGLASYSNVAAGKTAKHSSLYPWYGGEASKAVDGNADPNWDSCSCSHTSDEDTSPWWYVDLGGTYIIKQVVITNRGDCCGERLANFTVEVFEDDPESPSSPRQRCYSRFTKSVFEQFRGSRGLKYLAFTTNNLNMAANGHKILKTYRIVDERWCPYRIIPENADSVYGGGHPRAFLASSGKSLKNCDTTSTEFPGTMLSCSYSFYIKLGHKIEIEVFVYTFLPGCAIAISRVYTTLVFYRQFRKLIDGGQTLLTCAGRIAAEYRDGGMYGRFTRRVFHEYRNFPGVRHVVMTVNDLNMAAIGQKLLKTYRIVMETLMTNVNLTIPEMKAKVSKRPEDVEGKTMDAENEHFRFYTFMRLKLGDNGKKILQDLQAVFGAKCVAPNRWNLKDLNAA
nr:hypothetical protein BaRGS_028555 [Batillaria attramentaria]